MKLLSASLIGLLTIVIAPLAFAGPSQSNGQTAGQALSFDELRTACLNPAKFHNQIAPTNIQVTCSDMQAKWVPDTDGSVSMACSRDIQTTVQSDKYSASSLAGSVRMTPQTSSCPKFKQVTETVQVVQALTCDQLTAYTGSVVDYCVDALNTLRGANPQAITQVETGRKMSLCGQTSSQRQGD